MTTDMFDELFAIAKAELVELDERVEGLPNPQVIVLLTDSNRFYVAVNDIDGIICEKLKQENDTTVLTILAMWKDGSVDVPSFAFRNTLVQMDERNLKAGILLNGIDGIHIRTLVTTLPPAQK